MSRGQNHFNNKWLDKEDGNGDRVGLYIIKVGEFTAKCNWCKADIAIGNAGYTAIRRHSTSRSHMTIAATRQQRVSSQPVLVAAQTTDEDVSSSDDPDPVTSASYDNVSEPESSAVTPANKGILRFLLQPSSSSVPLTESNNNSKVQYSFTDQVAKAEILMTLQSVSKNYSMNSLDSLVEVIKMSFPDSKIAEKMTLGRHKASYVITEALGPHFLNEVIADIKKSDSFALGTDTATTKHQGLSKGMDIKIRYYSEKYGQVVDSYLCTINLGHETSQIMADVVEKKVKEEHKLDLSKLFVLSRDNPNVIKGFGRILNEKCIANGNPKMIESPCSLHPCHTSLKKGLDEMSFNPDLFLVDIHGFFKLSTARREDLDELRAELEAEGEKEFFHRHVASRWLTMGPTTERVLKHWKVLLEYFIEFLHKSTDKSHAETQKNDRFKKIVEALKPSARKATFSRLKLITYLCSRTENYLRIFQSEKPMIHRIHTENCQLVSTLMASFVKPENIPKSCNGKVFRNVNLDDPDVLLSPKRCDFGAGVAASLQDCSEDLKLVLRKEFRTVMIKMTKYLLSHLPLENNLLKDFSYISPHAIEKEKFVSTMMRIAAFTKRFSDTELQNLDNQLRCLQVTTDIPSFDDSKHSLEVHWLKKIIVRVKESSGMEVLELSKLIKIVSVYPNSQAWLERGFNDTKRIADSRQSLSEKCMAANKLLLDEIRRAGGPANVVISQDLIGAHHSARHTYRARLLKEQQDKEKDEKLKKQLEQSQARKRKYEEEKGSWDKKVQKVKDDIRDLKEKIAVHEKNQMKAFEDATKAKSSNNKEAFFEIAKLSTCSIKELRSELDKKQENLAKIMSKIPKLQ